MFCKRNYVRIVSASLLILAGLACSALCYEDNSYHGFASLEMVKQQYGENPQDAVAKVFHQPEFSNESWQKAVAAAAFLGAEGAALLQPELRNAVKTGDYESAAVLFDSLRRINDKRSFNSALAILDSAAPIQLKIASAELISVQVDAMPNYSIPNAAYDDARFRIYGSITDKIDWLCSAGEPASIYDALAARKTLLRLQPSMEKKNLKLAKQLHLIIGNIDEKMRVYLSSTDDITIRTKDSYMEYQLW